MQLQGVSSAVPMQLLVSQCLFFLVKKEEKLCSQWSDNWTDLDGGELSIQISARRVEQGVESLRFCMLQVLRSRDVHDHG